MAATAFVMLIAAVADPRPFADAVRVYVPAGVIPRPWNVAMPFEAAATVVPLRVPPEDVILMTSFAVTVVPEQSPFFIATWKSPIENPTGVFARVDGIKHKTDVPGARMFTLAFAGVKPSVVSLAVNV